MENNVSDDEPSHQVLSEKPTRERVSSGLEDEVRIPALRFVEGSEFQTVCGCVVCFNILELAGETDSPDWPPWSVLDQIFLLAFAAELALRISFRGAISWAYKDRGWAILDGTLVVIGIFELWILGLVLPRHSPLMQHLRLWRLARFCRLFKLFPKLTSFLSALMSMVHTFVWVFLVLFLFLLVSAILMTHIVGKGELLGVVVDEEDGREHFSNVPAALFTLFRVITQDDWNDIAGPIISACPPMRLFFVFFIAFASWTLISVLTGVASDEMIAATSNRKEEERQEQERRQKEFINFLRKCFYDFDSDGNEVLDKDEFAALMQGASMQQHMQTVGLDMTLDAMRQAWIMLDVDGHGQLTIDDFVEGLSYLQETLSVKHIISIDYSVKRTSVRLEKCLDKLLDELIQVGYQSKTIVDFLGNQDILREKLNVELATWRAWAAKNNPSAVSSKRMATGLGVLRRERSVKRDTSTVVVTGTDAGAMSGL